MEQEDFICRSFPWQGVPKVLIYFLHLSRHPMLAQNGQSFWNNRVYFLSFLKKNNTTTTSNYQRIFFTFLPLCIGMLYKYLLYSFFFLQQPNLYLSTELKFGGTQTTAFIPVVEVQAVLDRPIMRTLTAGSRSIQVQIFNK